MLKKLKLKKMTYTIKTSEIERLTKELYLKNEDEEILEVDIVELNETDQHGDHFGLSFKAKINMEFLLKQEIILHRQAIH